MYIHLKKVKVNRCLYCYGTLADGHTDFHPACSKKIFGTAVPPFLPYSEDQLNDLALQIIQSQTALTGVQPKLSLDIDSSEKNGEPNRFTLVGLWGGYILKPQTSRFPFLPEVEDLTMHLASVTKIRTVPHTLIRMRSGTLAYLTKRIDRKKRTMVHMEDMCQLTERLTEDKYKGSYEQIGKAIVKYSTNPVFDLIEFFEQVLFSYLTGNADMHLKNFSLINDEKSGYILSPAYDMVATALVNPADKEELALTLNGKKKKIRRSDFTNAFRSFKLLPKQEENIFKKLAKAIPLWIPLIDKSFLPEEMKENYKALIIERKNRLEIL